MTTTLPPSTSTTTGPSRARRRDPKRIVRTIGFHTGGTLLALVWLAPIVLVVLTSIRTFDDILARGIAAWPTDATLDGYAEAWARGGMAQAMVNSGLITVPTLIMTMLLASLAAYALSRYRVPFRLPVLLVMLAGNLLPPQMIIVPVSNLMQQTGLYDTLIAAFIIQTAFGIGFYTFVLHGFMRAIPFEVQDAAAIDGAGVLRTYWSVILPLTRPALAALSALCFTWVFNDLLFTITVIQTESNLPVTPAILSLQGTFGTEWNLMTAATVIAALPCAVVFLLAQRSFLGGLTLGAVK